MVYDAAGNLTNDGAHPYTYDPENRLLTAGGVTYTYDGDGKRVKKSNGTLYWTGPGWDPLLETDLSGNATEEYVFFNGDRVARVDMPANTVEYYFSDHLKSTDIVTNATGGIVRESDYVPYGGEVVISGTDPNHYKFTGKERDPESGLDDFDARFYSSPFGRFMTPDWAAKAMTVPYAKFGNPQSLNLYSYVQNNPTTVSDPDGHDALWIVDARTGQTTLVIPVHITGRGATPVNISTIVNRDNTLNIGNSPVNLQVMETDKPVNGVLNRMDLSPGYDYKNYPLAGEGVNKLGGDSSHINSANTDATDAAAHDILHFAGIKDQYQEGPRNAQGNRTSTPTPGYNNSNIMTSRPGTDLKPEQIKEAEKNKTTKQCTKSGGKIVCK